MISKSGSSWQQVPYNTNGRSKKLSLHSTPAQHSGLIYPSRWENWSKVIAGRYISDAARRRPANIVFVRRVSSPSSFWRVFRLGPFLLSPRINLGTLIHQRALHQTVRNEVSKWQSLPSRRDESGRPAEPVVATAFVSQVTESLRRPLRTVIVTEHFVDRMLQRRESPQAIAASVPPRATVRPVAMDSERIASQMVRERSAAQRMALRPPAMVLQRRSGSAQDSSSALQSARPRAPIPSTFPADPAPGTYPSVTPVVDVSRLTDQVLQTIDRRLTSWRERMGRI